MILCAEARRLIAEAARAREELPEEMVALDGILDGGVDLVFTRGAGLDAGAGIDVYPLSESPA